MSVESYISHSELLGVGYRSLWFSVYSLDSRGQLSAMIIKFSVSIFSI